VDGGFGGVVGGCVDALSAESLALERDGGDWLALLVTQPLMPSRSRKLAEPF